MKALFQAIRKSDINKVKVIIEKDKTLVNCCAKQPPKKDDGQSPLQVAFKTGNFDIADYLVEQGANTNFIETESINEWKAPVIHDAIRATVFSSRFPGCDGIRNSKETFERALSSLKNIIDKGANVKAIDSYGNNCIMRATLDARQLSISDENKELIEDLTRVFALLISSGADVNESNQERDSVIECFKGEPVSRFFYL
jgi:ankyrin repeat protein